MHHHRLYWAIATPAYLRMCLANVNALHQQRSVLTACATVGLAMSLRGSVSLLLAQRALSLSEPLGREVIENQLENIPFIEFLHADAMQSI
jgi:hypothetical protein